MKYQIVKIKTHSSGKLDLEYKYGYVYDNLDLANQDCERTMEYYKRCFDKRNKTIGEFLIIIDSKARICGVHHIVDKEIFHYTSIHTAQELQEFAYEMKEWADNNEEE